MRVVKKIKQFIEFVQQAIYFLFKEKD